ncbi:homoprotocatechuate degradation operon regulator HpaR [Azospirillum sp. TSO22-1]|uniref:homoprotocatechuate degradation operon regulator HpaR n=1 Tax=Azospirillum sp. TSO22-1 TaxID=716789 RepID=UPI000D621807|nr:homoprotocatechuate degradation operon regulator HpaR [Azospirillum sp. TSO22-1]PWC35167.1 MarR family transcriptional regulator [Azospirillum sp. TSO22-1]
MQAINRRNLPLLLLRVREAVFSHFRPIVSHFGLTEQQWRIVRALGENGEMEQNQIVEACQILAPSLAGVLARMEEVDLVRRRRHETDLRRVLVSLTPRGEDIVRHMAPLVKEQYELLEKAVGRAAVEGLYAALDAYLDAARTPVPAVVLPPADTALAPHRERRRKAG